MNSFKFLFLSVVVVSVLSCKNDTSKSTTEVAEVKSGNEVKALEAVGAKDLSTALKYDQKQFIPEENCGFNFKSQNAMRLYIRNLDTLTKVDFTKDEIFAIFVDSAYVETNFAVSGIDLKGNPSLISVTTIPTHKPTNKHRPSFVISVPKKDVKGQPIFKLNGKEIQVTAID